MRLSIVTLVLLALATVLGSGCSCRRTPAGRSDRGAATGARDCEARRAEIRTLISKASRACTTNADCRSYPGGPVDCGGAVDGASAARLWELTEAFRAQQCGFAVHCAPRAVRATCRDGRCLEEPIGAGRRP